MTEQTSNLNRVSNSIAPYVESFLTQRINEEFFNADLHSYVSERVPIAPGSADRIMRALRASGRVNYELVDRSRSLYRALPVSCQLELFK